MTAKSLLEATIAAKWQSEKRRKLLFILAIAFISTTPQAGDESQFNSTVPTFSHYSLEELMAVEVRAPTKTEMTLMEAPGVGEVITRAEMDAFGWRTLKDILLRQPGFSPSQDYERVTVSSRGQYESWNNNHLRLLVNGLPVNNITNGTAYIWDMVPLSLVESIEIVRGPGSALYGSNATNGVIAINTRQPKEQAQMEATLALGNGGNHLGSLSGSKSFANLKVLAGYKYQGSEGNEYESYDASRRADPNGQLRLFSVNDTHSSHSAYLFLEGQGSLQGLSLQSQIAYWNFETGHGWLYRIPDEEEKAFNAQEMLSLSYKPSPLLDERLKLEFAASVQNTVRNYDIKLLPDSLTFLGAPMPDGITEILHSKSKDIFSRAQAEYRWVDQATALLGLENTLYFSEPNSRHQSNLDLNRGGSFAPFPDGQLHDLHSTSEYIDDHPIVNTGLFLQFNTGRILHRKFSATVGSRYDFLSVQFRDLDQTGKPLKEKFLDQVSPRIGLVYFPTETWSIKALAEQAFRAPAPSELFSTNSLLGFSNPGPLQAEILTAYTLASDIVLFRHLNLRIDGFIQEFENQIAFSGSKNYSSNVYSRTVNGVESEVRYQTDLPGEISLTSFVNHTLSHQLSEKTLEPSIAMSDRLTWAPEHVANLGALIGRHGLTLSIQVHYQGTVYRRTSDYLSADGTETAYAAYRPRSLDPWTTLDMVLAYAFQNGLKLQVRGTNVLNEDGYLMKPGNYPFDYQIETARFEGQLEYSFGFHSRRTALMKSIPKVGE